MKLIERVKEVEGHACQDLTYFRGLSPKERRSKIKVIEALRNDRRLLEDWIQEVYHALDDLIGEINGYSSQK